MRRRLRKRLKRRRERKGGGNAGARYRDTGVGSFLISGFAPCGSGRVFLVLAVREMSATGEEVVLEVLKGEEGAVEGMMAGGWHV